MTKYYEIQYGEPYEPSYTEGITEDKEAAEHYCNEANQCTESWGTYYVIDHRPPPILDLALPLMFSFTFQAGNLELESSSTYCLEGSDGGYDQEEGTISVNGTGSTYEECLKNALGAAVAIRSDHLKEHF